MRRAKLVEKRKEPRFLQLRPHRMKIMVVFFMSKFSFVQAILRIDIAHNVKTDYSYVIHNIFLTASLITKKSFDISRIKYI